MMYGTVDTNTVHVDYSKTTSAATGGGSSASVQSTASGSSSGGGAWSQTSTDGSYAYATAGIDSTAHVLVPVGSDGLQYAFGNAPTTFYGDWLLGPNDVLDSTSMSPWNVAEFSRSFGTAQVTQQTAAGRSDCA